MLDWQLDVANIAGTHRHDSGELRHSICDRFSCPQRGIDGGNHIPEHFAFWH